MVLLGVDPHKDTHTVVAVDAAGRQLDQTTVPARTLGHGELVGWARTRWPEPAQRIWAVEDCRHVTSRLERDLLAAGERIVRVPPGWWPVPARPCGSAASPTRWMPWRSPARRCVSPSFRSPSTIRPPGRSSCWSTTASTWSPSGPDTATGCAGTSLRGAQIRT